MTHNRLVEGPPAHQTAHTDARDSLDDRRRVVGARLQKGGGTRLEGFQENRQPAVYLILRGEDRGDISVNVVGPRPATEIFRRQSPVHGVIKMHVGIHETGHDELPFRVNRSSGGEFPVQLLRLSDCGDPVGYILDANVVTGGQPVQPTPIERNAERCAHQVKLVAAAIVDRKIADDAAAFVQQQ